MHEIKRSYFLRKRLTAFSTNSLVRRTRSYAASTYPHTKCLGSVFPSSMAATNNNRSLAKAMARQTINTKTVKKRLLMDQRVDRMKQVMILNTSKH